MAKFALSKQLGQYLSSTYSYQIWVLRLFEPTIRFGFWASGWRAREAL